MGRADQQGFYSAEVLFKELPITNSSELDSNKSSVELRLTAHVENGTDVFTTARTFEERKTVFRILLGDLEPRVVGLVRSEYMQTRISRTLHRQNELWSVLAASFIRGEFAEKEKTDSLRNNCYAAEYAFKANAFGRCAQICEAIVSTSDPAPIDELPANKPLTYFQSMSEAAEAASHMAPESEPCIALVRLAEIWRHVNRLKWNLEDLRKTDHGDNAARLREFRNERDELDRHFANLIESADSLQDGPIPDFIELKAERLRAHLQALNMQ